MIKKAGQSLSGAKRKDRKWYSVVLFIISVIVYANTIFNGYTLDDRAVITHNNFVKKGITGVPDILSSPSLKGFSERPTYDTSAVNDIYRPVSMVMFAVAQSIFGSSPVHDHVLNVFFFAGCVLLFFRFTIRVFDYRNTAVAFAAALLFAVHPVHTEVVANIKSRDELLCFFLAFNSLLLFQRYMSTGFTFILPAAAYCYCISLLAKETSISFIAILPLICIWYTPAHRKRGLFIAIAATAAASVYLYMRYSVLNAHNANHPELIDFIENPLSGAPSLSAHIATSLLIMGNYIQLLFWPYPLCSDYTFATIPFTDFSNVYVWLSLAAYVALAVIGVHRLISKPRDPIALGIIFFLVTILLFSNLFFFIGSMMAERFLFFPSAGFCIIMASLLGRFIDKQGDTQILWLFLVPVALLLATITVRRNRNWKDNYTLFRTDVEKNPGNARLWHSLGYELTTTQMATALTPGERNGLIVEGIDCYHKSLAIYPVQSKVHADLGNLFMLKQQYDSAEIHLKEALRIKPNDPVYTSALGGVYFVQGQYRKTLSLCKQALLKAPGNTALLNNIGLCYLQMGVYDSALLVSERVLQLEPGNILAKNNVATANKMYSKP
ncbi:MAG: DUF1736 domain-containing protein [Taibaiella sp.]|nr:DUF1736 domain-containing protein [Taibaiella sp.]